MDPRSRSSENLRLRQPGEVFWTATARKDWRGKSCDDVLPVEEVGWLCVRDLLVKGQALRAEFEPGPFQNDPGNQRRNEYRYEQGTRVRRSLVISFLRLVWLL